MSDDRQLYQRATNAALAALAVQLIVALGLLLLALWSGAPALEAAAWHAFGGLPLWACLWAVFQQHRLERLESLEAEELARRHGTDTSIFETTADDLSVARRRLGGLYKWAVPAVSLVASAYLAGIGAWLLVGYETAEGSPLAEGASPLAMGFIAAGLTFIAFLVSRYVAGMARLEAWRLLRGGAAYLMGVAVVGAAETLALFLIAGFEAAAPLRHLGWLVPLFMIAVGAEMALNFVLDLYRPRRPGETRRPAFDSRLLSLLTTPESIAKTINEAINYQFGFEITRSWFWQLLSRVFGWLVAFAALVLLAISTIVIVEPNEQAIVTRFGRLAGEPLKPGIHLKLPWPISRATRFDVTSVRDMAVGSNIALKEGVPVLWTNPHTESSPRNLIVAPPDYATGGRADRQGAATSISLVNAEVEVRYRVHPDRLVRYFRANPDARLHENRSRPDTRLRQIAEQQVSRHLLRHNIDAWIGGARAHAGEQLRQRIAAEAERHELGVQVLGVSVEGIHPPRDVADSFHAVVGAEQTKQATIQQAKRDAVRTVVEVAGARKLARTVVDRIEKLEKMQANRAAGSKIDDAEREIERLIRERARGASSQTLAEARAYRWKKENNARGDAARFSGRLTAYEKAPKLYRMRELLSVLETGLPDARKFLLSSEFEDLTIRGDFTEGGSGFSGVMEQVTGSGGNGSNGGQ